MTWLWPTILYLLGIIPLIIGVYIWILRRRRRFTVRYSSLSLIREALPRYSQLRRHLPFALFLLALASLIVAFARPVSIITVPSGQVSIILAIDVSRSMCSTDIHPSRLQAAESAAIAFIQKQKSNTLIGLVAFSSFAELIQPPTNDQELLQTAVDSLLVGRRTGIGNGILKSLDAIAEIDKSVAPSSASPLLTIQPTPVPKGAYAPDIIVLLTDGASNTGISPVEAAQEAADRGVRIYTIGFGTANGGDMSGCQNSDPFGYFGFGGQFGGGNGRFRRGIDEATLKQVSAMTGGAYYPAESAKELQNVFKNLPTYLITKHETTEVSVFFVAAGALLALIAILLSLIWHPLP